MGLLGSLLKGHRQMLVVSGDELFGDFISFVQPLDPVHPPPFTILGDEVSVDDCRLFVHELLHYGMAVRLWVGLLMDMLEDRSPDTTVALGVTGRRLVAEPAGDPLNRSHQSLASLKDLN